MQPKIKILQALILTCSVSIYSCEKVDFKGMIIPDESANERFLQSMTWNRNHKPREIFAATDNYTILSMGDSHVGDTGNFDNFINIAKCNNPAAVVMAGDLTNGLKEDYDKIVKHLPDKSSFPVFILAGNHDLNFDSWNLYYDTFGSSTYIFTVTTPVATDLYICLETAGATLGDKQLNWLTGILKNKRSECRHCIVYTHTNFFTFNHVSGSLMPVEEMESLMDLFRRYNVEMEITAHDHKQHSDIFGGTNYIIMPALVEGTENPGYFELTVAGNDLSYNFRNI